MSHLDEGLLHAMLDGELELGEVRQVQAHLGSCASCDTRLKEVRELMAESDRLVATLEPPERTEFAPPLTPTDPPLRASTDLPPLLLLPDEEDAGRRRRRVAMFGIAAAVLVTVGGGLLVQRYNQPDVDELFRASANVPASADSAAVVSSLEAGQPASEPPFSASAPPPAPARASSPETRTAPPVESAPSPRRAAPARPRAGSESGGDVVARRALAAKATAELEQELRLSRARAATAALDSARRAREDDDRRARERASAEPAPAPVRTPEQRAQITLRVGLDEASRQLGRPVHVIEGMSSQFIGLASGRQVPGADPSRQVVRVVYQDAAGRMIYLDQQRIVAGQAVPTGSTASPRWTVGDVLVYLHGELGAEALRNLQRRVR